MKSRIAFTPFQKIPRLNRQVVITEKIDGTACVLSIREDDDDFEFGFDTQVDINGAPHYLRAGSKNGWIRHGLDHFGFSKWAYTHAHQLASLGVGDHWGEWWGFGIQSGYGQFDRNFSLFNTGRWKDMGYPQEELDEHLPDRVWVPACCRVVPILGVGNMNTSAIDVMLDFLNDRGSLAAPGEKAEGVVIYHTASKSYYKATCEKDDKPKKFALGKAA